MSFSQGMKLLDMMPTGYNPEYARSLFTALGEKGRDAYLYQQIPVDLIYPFLFAISSCLVLAYFLNQLKKLEGALFYLCFIPIFSGIFDYCENIGIISMLTNYPNNSDLSISTTSLFSLMKSTSTICYFSILIILLITLGFKKLLTKSSH